MYNLLRKDILVQKNSLWFCVGYSIFIFFAFSGPTFRPLIYVMGATVIAYVLVLSAIQAEFKNNSDLILLSFPVKRQQVVASKYIGVLIFTFIALAVIGLLGLILSFCPLPFPTRLINWTDAVITVISVMLLTSIYLPIYYKTAGRWVQIINAIVFMVIFFVPSSLVNLASHQQILWLEETASQNPWLLTVLALAIMGIIFYASYLISLRIYQRKDF
ncbi:MAG: ABC-2 transporter permease [Syntrophomonadaceae bacterium]|jgi:ABC-2 type transport system permease protein